LVGRGPTVGERLAEILRILILPLVLAGLLELFLNRAVSRATIFVPKSPPVAAVLAALAALGFFLLALAFLLAAVWLGSWAARWLIDGDGARGTALPASALFFSILSVAAISGPGPPVAILFGGVFLLVISMLLVRLWGDGRPWKALILAIWAAYTLYALWVILSHVGSLWPNLQLGAADELSRVGEAVALLGTAALFATESRTDDGRWILTVRLALVAAIPAALFAFLVSLSRALVANISIWSTGFSLFLPWPVYAAAIWLFTAGLLAARRRGRRKEFLAYLLILISGYNLSLTYTYVTGVIALVLLLPDDGLTRPDRAHILRDSQAPGSAP